MIAAPVEEEEHTVPAAVELDLVAEPGPVLTKHGGYGLLKGKARRCCVFLCFNGKPPAFVVKRCFSLRINHPLKKKTTLH